MQTTQKIQNKEQLATTEARKHALEIVESGLNAIDTEKAIRTGVTLSENTLRINDREFNLEGVERFVLVGIGKCALDAATALEDVLGDRIDDGAVLDVREGTLKRINSLVGTHPFPSEENVVAAGRIIELLEPLTENDFVLFVISGGGSTLLCRPENMTCQEESDIVSLLFDKGATIQEINTIRKHLSIARGGHLAKHAYPARSVSLIFSDVPGDNLEFISSGPTVKDTTTVEEAKKISHKYELAKHLNIHEENFIQTPKDDKYFDRVTNMLFISNRVALRAMAKKAEELGYTSDIRNTRLSGEARDAGKKIVDDLARTQSKTALLYGGETTVTVTKPGKGGRSLELTLSALRSIQDDMLISGFASDGRDNTDFAGAIADTETKKHAEQKNLDPKIYLNNNQSYIFFESTGDYLKTGITGSNVSDLVVALKS